MFEYEAKVIRWVDGDTCWLDVDLGFRMHAEIEMRLAHINTPEIVNYKPNGIDDPATKYCNECCPPDSICVVQVTRPEKWGRWLATIKFRPGETKRDAILMSSRVLNDELLQKGLAVPYEGGKK